MRFPSHKSVGGGAAQHKRVAASSSFSLFILLRHSLDTIPQFLFGDNFSPMTKKQTSTVSGPEEELLLNLFPGNKLEKRTRRKLSISRIDKFIPWMGGCRFLRGTNRLKAFSACTALKFYDFNYSKARTCAAIGRPNWVLQKPACLSDGPFHGNDLNGHLPSQITWFMPDRFVGMKGNGHLRN